jgi:hypothetical protein
MLSVVVVVKMVATDFSTTTMQNDVFLGYMANSHGNLLVIICRSLESQPFQILKKRVQNFWGIWKGWLAYVTNDQ